MRAILRTLSSNLSSGKLKGFVKYASVQGIDVVSQAFLLTIGWSNFVRVEFMYWDGVVLITGSCSVLNTGRLRPCLLCGQC